VESLDGVLGDGWSLVADDRFAGPELDVSVWLPSYLPQWTTRERAAARYRLAADGLHLRIEDDQPAWSEALDGPLRVSSLQTGLYAGPVGSRTGQHRVHPEATVLEEWQPVRLLTPRFGAVAVTASWTPHPDQMVALWMIGYEDRRERSAEICVAEIFGAEVGGQEALVGMGLHPFADPGIVDDFEKVRVEIDIRRPHEYGVVVTPGRVRFFVDGGEVKRSAQAPDYPMQIMLSIFDFRRGATEVPRRPFVIQRFRCWDAPTG
jgi:hypothetical protein